MIDELQNNKQSNHSEFEFELNLDVHSSQFVNKIFHNIRNSHQTAIGAIAALTEGRLLIDFLQGFP